MDIEKNVLLLPLCFWGLYLILEASDWGLCIAAPLVSRTREENRAILGLLRPGIDGNECWFFIGLYMLLAALPDMGEGPYYDAYLLLGSVVGGGAILRFVAVMVSRWFSHPWGMRLLALYGSVSVVMIGFLAASALLPDGRMFSLLGVSCAVWTVLAAFQVGSLYGAGKVIQPLAERFRAAFLVSCILSAVSYVVFALLLKQELGELWRQEGYFWMLLIATSILFCISFFFTRRRHVKVGLIATYFAAFFAISIYLVAYGFVLPAYHSIDVIHFKAAMDALPGAVLLLVAVIWTLGSFVWRQKRKKQEYVWEDHI